MKYVMFTNQTGVKLPVFCAEHFTHASMKADPGWTATSAGFYTVKDRGECYGKSDSLNLSPKPDDALICTVILTGLDSMVMLHQDFDQNLKDLEERKAQLRKAEKPLPGDGSLEPGVNCPIDTR